MVTRLQLERAEVAFFVYTNGSELRSNLSQRFERTDSAIGNLSSWYPVAVLDNKGITVQLDKATFQKNLWEFRYDAAAKRRVDFY